LHEHILDEDCCNCNVNIEEAEVAATCCIHGSTVCHWPVAAILIGRTIIRSANVDMTCPKSYALKYTVPAIIIIIITNNINNEQIEVISLVETD
jgi:hypothetical protein